MMAIPVPVIPTYPNMLRHYCSDNPAFLMHTEGQCIQIHSECADNTKYRLAASETIVMLKEPVTDTG